MSEFRAVDYVGHIVERGVYAKSPNASYFRQVEQIVISPARAGGQVVQWSIDAFNVKDGKGRTHGKCSIVTFARWAKVKLS